MTARCSSGAWVYAAENLNVADAVWEVAPSVAMATDKDDRLMAAVQVADASGEGEPRTGPPAALHGCSCPPSPQGVGMVSAACGWLKSGPACKPHGHLRLAGCGGT